MKILIILFFFIVNSILLHAQLFYGEVRDSETEQPLQNANIILIAEDLTGTATDKNGFFTITRQINNEDKIEVSYVGYETFIIDGKDVSALEFKESDGKRIYIIPLTAKILASQTVLVEASVGERGITPVAFEKVDRKTIEENYTVYDIPKYLSDLPSTTFYYESGNAIGYNYVSIRGFDQRRISVSINGIPQNDPEDHNVYWLDFPDLLASTGLIQVQRGAGSGVFGYPAIGGSINLITTSFSNRPKLELSAAYGSFVTRKYSAAFSSGLIDGKYAVYGKLGQILSSGYKNQTWVDFKSYFLSAVRYDPNFTTQFNFYGGPIADGLGYTGIAKFAVKDLERRKDNFSYWEADDTGYTYVVPRRPEEIENFSQPHFELLNEWQINSELKFNSALFLVLGDGFFDYDGSWSVFYDDYFRLKENGFDTSYVPTNALIRAMVENTQYGWIPRFSLNHGNGILYFGAELRNHRSLHWGSINFAENLPPGVTKEYRYYSYRGGKDIVSAFVHESYTFNEQINLLGELQLAYHKYKLYDEVYVGTEFNVENLFINPRVGINYKPISGWNIYFSFARVSREPRLKNYYDAAESSAGEEPQFEKNPDGTFNFDKPLVNPETMNDFELGATISGKNHSVTLNLFYMLFNDEIVKSGQLDRFGQPITGNVDRTVHAGVELSFILKFLKNKFEIIGNGTISRNTIEVGNYFIDSDNFINLSGNRIAGFPDYLANLSLVFNDAGWYFRIIGKYVGDFFSDNYDENLDNYLKGYPGFVGYTDNVNEAYFVSDFFARYQFPVINTLTPWKIYVQVNNIFDNFYSAYAIGKEFFPAAERNWLVGIQIGL
ncbi:MAG: TonB-dependent receptor [Ignavibacterium sp.]|nr:MAG: TonB-dependent receptor [Ignavibacterium sp.]